MKKFCPFCGVENSQINKEGFTCANCQRQVFFNSIPCVCVIPLFEGKMLLCERGIEPAKGKIDVVGGFLKNGENTKDGAIREFEEETGVLISKDDLEIFEAIVDEYTFQGEKFFTLDVIYIIHLKEDQDFKPADDVARLFWADIEKREDFGFAYLNKVVDKLKKEI